MSDDGDDVRALLATAAAHVRDGRPREALRSYDAAYRRGVPDEARRHFLVGYGSALREVGRVDDAVGVLSQAVVDDPGYPPLTALLALALLDAGHPRAALAAMLGAALDAARPDAFDGFERALAEHHVRLLEPPG